MLRRYNLIQNWQLFLDIPHWMSLFRYVWWFLVNKYWSCAARRKYSVSAFNLNLRNHRRVWVLYTCVARTDYWPWRILFCRRFGISFIAFCFRIFSSWRWSWWIMGCLFLFTHLKNLSPNVRFHLSQYTSYSFKFFFYFYYILSSSLL